MAVDGLPYWSGPLRNGYWQLRVCRPWQASERRKWYRRIAGEKKRLQAAGVDAEQIRLLCLCLVNPKLEHRWMRYKDYVANELPKVVERRSKESCQLQLFE